jgi:hypothetical protein
VRPIEVVKWSTIQVQKSRIYLQFALQLNRRLRGEEPISGLRFNCNRHKGRCSLGYP